MRRSLALISVIVVACSTGGVPTTDVPGTTVTTPTTSAEPSPEPTTAPVTPQTAPTPGSTAAGECFAEGLPFEQEGFMGRRDVPGDATTLSDISWTDSGGCAAVTISFRTAQGAPAVDPPAYRGEFLRDLGVIRIAFGPPVDDATISNLAIETPLMEASHVVFDSDTGQLELDITLANAALGRIRTASAPARLVIELVEGGPPLPERPPNGPSTVLLSPSPATTTGPIVVEGYGLAGSALAIRVRSNGPVRERVFDLAPSPTAWTRFRWTVEQLPTGLVEVQAGDAPTLQLNLQ